MSTDHETPHCVDSFSSHLLDPPRPKFRPRYHLLNPKFYVLSLLWGPIFHNRIKQQTQI